MGTTRCAISRLEGSRKHLPALTTLRRFTALISCVMPVGPSCLAAEQAGIRAILTHPINEAAARFDTRFGCIASPLRQQQRLLLLKDAKKILR